MQMEGGLTYPLGFESARQLFEFIEIKLTCRISGYDDACYASICTFGMWLPCFFLRAVLSVGRLTTKFLVVRLVQSKRTCQFLFRNLWLSRNDSDGYDTVHGNWNTEKPK